jgi:cytochrome c peroxidase
MSTDPHFIRVNPRSIFLFCLAAMLAFTSACKKSPDPASYHPTSYILSVPRHFPQTLNIPSDNPLTLEGIALGRALFYDPRLDGRSAPDSQMCCATCHLQSHAFVCGIDHPKYIGGHPFGVTGIPTTHYMLPLENFVWNSNGYLWNGAVVESNPVSGMRNLEDVVGLVITLPSEMNTDTNRVKVMIQSIPGYAPMFRAAFGSETVTARNIEKAIAQFIRTFVSVDSKFDRFMEGSVQLTPSELNGYVQFMTEQGGDCFHCHGGDGNPLFTTNLFYNNGKDSVFTDPYDRYAVTGNPQDKGSYRAPTLRNLVFKAPYMHDGRFKTIDEVLNFYNTGLVWSPTISPLMHHIATHGVHLTPQNLADLKAFLLTLTDSTFVTNPDYGPPPSLPK